MAKARGEALAESRHVAAAVDLSQQMGIVQVVRAMPWVGVLYDRNVKAVCRLPQRLVIRGPLGF